MSHYDQLAMASQPSFYLAAPLTVDQAATETWNFTVNNLATNGQPIIYGHANSFEVDATTGAILEGNLVFRTGITTECVVYANRPAIEAAIILADNGSALTMTSTGISLRLIFDNNGVSQSIVLEVPVVDWSKKLHILITIGSSQAVLTVNGKSDESFFDGILDSNITSTSIGSESTDKFLLDGLGIYRGRIENKIHAINDNTQNHAVYAATVFNGKTTLFDSFTRGDQRNIALADFTFDPVDESFSFSYPVPAMDAAYVSIETNDDALEINYDLNFGGVQTFTKATTIALSAFSNTLSFRIPNSVKNDFSMYLQVIISADIYSATPAFLVANSDIVFARESNDSIVNCPVGVRNASYSGTWLYSDAHEDPPQTIEIVFKPHEEATIFSGVTTAVQAGYDMWLNGISVVDLTNIKWNQWNHLVLINAAPTEDTFELNPAMDAIDYLFLTAYPQELDQAAIEQLYNIAIGIDAITVNEAPLVLVEGEFENGQAYQLLNNTWAIVGAGGN